MANYKTGAQRYNDRMDKLFSGAMQHMSETKSGKMYDRRFYRENKKGGIVKAKSKALDKAKK